MLKKITLYLFRMMSFTLLGVLLLLSFVFCLLHSRFAKDRLIHYIENTASKQGHELKLKGVSGDLPWNWSILEGSFKTKEGSEFFFKKLELELSPKSLVTRSIVIKNCTVDFLCCKVANKKVEKTKFSIPSFAIDSVHVHKLDLQYEDFFADSIQIDGKTKWNPKKHKIAGSLFLKHKASFLQIEAKNQDFLSFFAKGHFESWKEIHIKEISGGVDLSCHFSGPYSSYKAIWMGKEDRRPINGFFQIQASDFTVLSKKLPKTEILTEISYLPGISWNFSSFSLFSEWIKAEGNALLLADCNPNIIHTDLHIPDLSLWSDAKIMQGDLQGFFDYNEGSFQFDLGAEEISIYGQPYVQPHLTLSAKKAADQWMGKMSIHAENMLFPLDGESHFAIKEDLLNIQDLSLTLAQSRLTADLAYHFLDQKAEGSMFLHVGQLSTFLNTASGHLSAKITLEEAENKQNLEMHVDFDQIRLREIAIQKGAIHAKAFNLFEGMTALIESRIENCYYRDVLVRIMEMTASNNGKTWKTESEIKGLWKDPFDLRIETLISKQKDKLQIDMEKLEGSILQNKFHLQEPFVLEKSADILLIKNFKGQFQDGFLEAGLFVSEEKTALDLHAKHVPVDFFSLLYPNISLKGYCSIDANFNSEKTSEGKLLFLLERGILQNEEKKDPLQTKGFFQAHLQKDTLQLYMHLIASEGQFFDLSSTLPIRYSQGKIEIRKDKPMFAELVAEGKIEDLFDCMDIGGNRLTGFLSGKLLLSGNFEDPRLLGKMNFVNGSYENYFSGTYFKKIETEMGALGKKIEINKFSASDEKDGYLKAMGEIFFSFETFFPYNIQLQLSELKSIDFDFVESKFSGEIHLEGNLKGALAKGILIPEATFHIPDSLPDPLPDLKIRYVNMPFEFQNERKKTPATFPLSMDIAIHAPKKIMVEGKGLRSEWHGDVQLTGTLQAPIALGNLRLLRGNYSFSGKNFFLSDGEIVFAHKNGQTAYLNLQGNLILQDMTVIAVLRGPLLSPQLNFQSIPQMPTSAILARVLFNKDLSEISPVQAFQLAQTIITLSGKSGVDVLDAIRKSLGVDRLTLVSSPNGSDQISLQIGKYITQGVMVTLSQGMDSSQVIVEVELQNGFILQAETQEQEEGKFSLKWNYNY